MQAVVGKAESHQDGRDAQVRGEIAHDRDRAAAANEHRLAAQDIAERACAATSDRGMIRIHADARVPQLSMRTSV